MRHLSTLFLSAGLLLSPLVGLGAEGLCPEPPPLALLRSPQLDPGYALGVSGHIAALMLGPKAGGQAALLMAGGCNFPEISAANGGAKRFYAEVYLHGAAEGSSAWRLVGRLPEPTAYAAGQAFGGGVIIAGGQTLGGRELDLVYRLDLDPRGRVQRTDLPRLPEPRSGMASALVGSRLYLIGGSVRGQLTTSAISLDLEHPEEGWRGEPHYPGAALLKVAATALPSATAGRIVMIGSFAHSEGEAGVSTSLSCFLLDTQEGGGWKSLPAPPDSLREGATFGGGWIRPRGQEAFAVGGGVNEYKFLPALERIQQLRRAKRLGQRKLVAQLEQESRQYLLHEPTWYRFTPFVLEYDLSQARWQRCEAETSPEHARADAAYVEDYIIGGEVKPGIRTNRISRP